MAKKVFQPREVAQRAQIRLDLTYQMLWAGRFEGAKRVEGKWQIPESAVTAYLERRKQRAAKLAA